MLWVPAVPKTTVRAPVARFWTMSGRDPSALNWTYAIRLPSGDQAGDMVGTPGGETGYRLAPSESTLQIRPSLRNRIRLAAIPGCPVAHRTISSLTRWMARHASPAPAGLRV